MACCSASWVLFCHSGAKERRCEDGQTASGLVSVHLCGKACYGIEEGHDIIYLHSSACGPKMLLVSSSLTSPLLLFYRCSVGRYSVCESPLCGKDLKCVGCELWSPIRPESVRYCCVAEGLP